MRILIRIGLPTLVVTLFALGIASGPVAAIEVPDVVRLSVDNLVFNYPGDSVAPALTLTINGALFWDNTTGRPAIGSVYTDQYRFGIFPYMGTWRDASGNLIGVVPNRGGGPIAGGQFAPFDGSVRNKFVLWFDYPSINLGPVTAAVIFPAEVRPDYEPASECCSWPPAWLVPNDAPISLDAIAPTTAFLRPDGTFDETLFTRPVSGSQSITTPEPATLMLLTTALTGVGAGVWRRRRTGALR